MDVHIENLYVDDFAGPEEITKVQRNPRKLQPKSDPSEPRNSPWFMRVLNWSVRILKSGEQALIRGWAR